MKPSTPYWESRAISLINRKIIICIGYSAEDVRFRDLFILAQDTPALKRRLIFLLNPDELAEHEWEETGASAPIRASLTEFVTNLENNTPANQVTLQDVYRGEEAPRCPASSQKHEQLPTHRPLLQGDPNDLVKLRLLLENSEQSLSIVSHPDDADDLWIVRNVLTPALARMDVVWLDAVGIAGEGDLATVATNHPAERTLVIFGLQFLSGKRGSQQHRFVHQLNQLRERLVRGRVVLLLPKSLESLVYKHARDLLDWSSLRISLDWENPAGELIRDSKSGVVPKRPTRDAHPPTQLTALRKALSRLFRSLPEIRLFAFDVGLDLSGIDFRQSPEAVWAQLIKHASISDELAKLMEAAARRYPADAELRSLTKRLRDAPDE